MGGLGPSPPLIGEVANKFAQLLQLGTSGFAEFSKFGKRVTGFTEFTESDQGISIDFTPKSSIKKKSRNISFDSQNSF